jgi:hypothetical protein
MKNKKKSYKKNIKKIVTKKKFKKKISKISKKVKPEIVKKERKRRTKNPTRMYFTQETEDAIVEYNNTEAEEVRNQIFREKIHFSFQKLVENIFNTFKFSYFETGPLDVQKECLSHLVANIHKYKKNKGKAFSYFSIIAKHYLILLNNTNYKKFNQNVEIGEERDEHTIQLQHVDKHHFQEEMSDFIKLIIKFWDSNIDRIFTKSRDLNIANAVIELFRNSDRIDAYNKKALYLYIREMAACKTQQITKVINKMKEYHTDIQKSYVEDGYFVSDSFGVV